jgi:hypothetical protein
MGDPHWNEAATAWGTIISAVAACIAAIAATYAAYLARGAANTWRLTLKEERADDCIGAARELAGTIGRCIALKGAEAELKGTEKIWTAYDQMWDSYVRFQQKFSAARRYHNLPEDLPKRVYDQLHLIGDLLRGGREPDRSKMKQAGNIEEAVNALLHPVYDL